MSPLTIGIIDKRNIITQTQLIGGGITPSGLVSNSAQTNLYPNLPIGLNFVQDRTFNTLPITNTNPDATPNQWVRESSGAKFSIESAAAQGFSNSPPFGDQVLEARVLATDLMGSSSHLLTYIWATTLTRIYCSWWEAHCPAWVDTMPPTNGNGHKCGFFKRAFGGAVTNHAMIFSGTDPLNFRLRFEPQFNPPDSSPSFYGSLYMGAAGVWRQHELYIDCGTPGVADGTVKWWVDGVLGLNRTNNIQLAPTGGPTGMRGVQWMTMMNGSGTFGINQERYLARYSIYGV